MAMNPVDGTDPSRWPGPLAHLLTGDVGAALAAVADPRLGPVVDWMPQQVTHRIGRSTTVQYRVTSGAPSGPSRSTALVLAHGIDGPRPVRSGGHDLVGWRLTADPLLPGLARALRPDRVSELLDLIGHPIGSPVLRRRAYRPGRRAVVEVSGPGGRVFLKVVRPPRSAALVDVHRRAGRTLPVPRVLGCTADGIVVLSAVPGRTLRSTLTSVGPDDVHRVDRLPGLTEVEALLDRLPRSHPGGPAARAWRGGDPVGKLRRQCVLIGTVLPDLRAELDDVVGAVGHRLRSDHPPAPVHGDLYESQLMVSGGTKPIVCGVLDLDTVGVGYRVDDIANLCAHLSTLALRSAPTTDPPCPVGEPAGPIGRYLAGIVSAAEADHDPVDLRARIAGRVVGMATGPFRVQAEGWPSATARRVALAHAWLQL